MKPAPPGYSKMSRLDKLGVRPGMRVAVLNVDDRRILKELSERTDDVATGRPLESSDMILFGVDGPKPLARLAAWRNRIKPDGMIWVIWPKGKPHIKEDMIRAAALAQDLVDVKVIAFSETLSGLKLVIPVAKR